MFPQERYLAGKREGICRILACEFVENMQLYCETLIKVTIIMILLNSTGLLYRLRGRKTEDWCNKVIWLKKIIVKPGEIPCLTII